MDYVFAFPDQAERKAVSCLEGRGSTLLSLINLPRLYVYNNRRVNGQVSAIA
jgi:hypothetical protein